MIPVGMGNKNISVYMAVFFEIICHEPVAQGPNTGPQINNNQPLIGPYFQAGSVAAEYHCIRAGTGN